MKHLIFIVLSTVIGLKANAQTRVGAGTRGGGEVVTINGELRFRDLVDNSTYRCIDRGQNFITSNPSFRSLMESFSESNLYASQIFSTEANNLIVCFVGTPLRYINTSDRCASQRSPNFESRSVIGVRQNGSHVLLVNKNRFDQLSANRPMDIATFLVHEVARSFIPYPEEGNCQNNTDVRNFARLIYDNHISRINQDDFDTNMAVYGVELPLNSPQHEHYNNAMWTVQDNTLSQEERLNAALSLKSMNYTVGPYVQEVIDRLVMEVRHSFVQAIMHSQLSEIEKLAPYMVLSPVVRIQRMSLLTYAASQRDLPLFMQLNALNNINVGDKNDTLIELVQQNQIEQLIWILNIPELASDITLTELVDAIILGIKTFYHLENNEDALVKLIESNNISSILDQLYSYALAHHFQRAILSFLSKENQGVARINLANRLGDTGISLAIIHGDYQRFVELMQIPNVDPAHVNMNQENYLHVAVSFNRLEVIRYLVNHHPHLKRMTNRAGRTPYSLAVRQNNLRAMRILGTN